MDMLNDDAIKSIGQSIGILYGVESYVSFASTCNRMRRLLLLPPSDNDTSKGEEDANDDSNNPTGDDQTSDILTNQVIEYVISVRVGSQYKSLCPSYKPEKIFFPNNIKTLHQLSIFEKWITETNFIHDNRITFPFASTEIESNMIERIHQITMLMNRYPKLRVRLDAHCGTAAPSGISSWFSRARGMSVWTAICGTEHDDNGIINEGSSRTTEEDNDNEEEEETGIDYTGRFQLVVWGKMITKVVSKLTQHPYYTDASEGRGWVEVYFIMSGDNNDREVEDEMILPRRHAYYNYRSVDSDSDTDSEDEDVGQHHHHPVLDLGNL